MKIETFIRGRSIGSEEPASAYQTYVSILAVHSGQDYKIQVDPLSVYNYSFRYFDIWFEDMIDHHEVHVNDQNDNRLLDQLLVTSA